MFPRSRQRSYSSRSAPCHSPHEPDLRSSFPRLVQTRPKQWKHGSQLLRQDIHFSPWALRTFPSTVNSSAFTSVTDVQLPHYLQLSCVFRATTVVPVIRPQPRIWKVEGQASSFADGCGWAADIPVSVNAAAPRLARPTGYLDTATPSAGQLEEVRRTTGFVSLAYG